MIDAGLENAAMAAFYDPEAAAVCHKAGVGAKIKLKLGGNFDIRFSEPIIAEGTVTHLSDGNFNIEGPMLKGLGVAMGPTATFKIGGVSVVINSRRFQNYDRNFFRAGGIEPTKLTFLAVKSSQHFRAAYAPLASEVIIKLPFENVPRPIYPLD
jgi:microcystin degradation protein MlrC